MYKKIALLLATLCLIQATPFDDVVKELEPKLEEAGLKIIYVLRFGGERIGLTRREIGISVSEAAYKIDKHETQIEMSVEEADTNATTSKRNISACVEQAKAQLETIVKSRASLHLCRISPELDNATLRLISLEKININRAVVKCSTQNYNDLDKIRTCVEDIVTDVESQADDTEKYIDSSVKEAKESNNKCVNDAVEPMNEHLNKIEMDFQNCVNNAKSLRD